MAIIGAVLFLVIILFTISKIGSQTKSYGYKKNYYKRFRKYNKRKRDITELRLENMDTGNISIKKIMNVEETKIFFSMFKTFRDYNIYKQVSFKAFLDAEEGTDVWKTFRDFYCDFLITYKKGNKINEPIAVIEYDGAGHFGNSENIKEKIKNNDFLKEKLIQKAGMQYFIIKEEDIKINDRFIDDTKLEDCLNKIIISLKSNN